MPRHQRCPEMHLLESWAGGMEPLHVSVKCHRVGACVPLSIAPTALLVTVTELVFMFVFQAAGGKTFFLLKFPMDPHPPGPLRGFSFHSKWRRQIGSAPGEASSTRSLMHYDHRYDFTFNLPQSSWISAQLALLCTSLSYVGFKDKRCLLQPTASLQVAGRPKMPRYLVCHSRDMRKDRLRAVRIFNFGVRGFWEHPFASLL